MSTRRRDRSHATVGFRLDRRAASAALTLSLCLAGCEQGRPVSPPSVSAGAAPPDPTAVTAAPKSTGEAPPASAGAQPGAPPPAAADPEIPPGIGGELAVRWLPAEGGPGTIDEVLGVLNLNAGDRKATPRCVRFYPLAQDSAPEGWRTILRLRNKDADCKGEKDNDKRELTWKRRGPSLENPRDCPAPFTGKETRELDVTLLAAGSRVVASYQCEQDGIRTGKRPDLAGADAPCAIDVSRLKVDDITIERWEIGGKVLMDISRKTGDPRNARDTFRTSVVDALKSAKARPTETSKTEWAMRCGKEAP